VSLSDEEIISAAKDAGISPLRSRVGDDFMDVMWPNLTAFARLIQKKQREIDAALCYEGQSEDWDELTIQRLRQVCRDTYEVWSGSEGVPVPETCAEAYLLGLVEKMRDEVKRGLK
jgi:hypothetical protein